MRNPVLHQFSAGATPGDAITDHAILLRKWIREAGLRSEIFAESIHPSLADDVHSYFSYRPRMKDEIVIYHHSIGSDVADYLLSLDVQVILIYHNVTPPEFVRDANPVLARQLEKGQDQLMDLKSATVLGLGDSAYDEEDLKRVGYDKTDVLPIVLDETRYDIPPNQDLLKQYREGSLNLVFVGRLVPNKCQEDLIKLLYYLRRIEADARLFLVGSAWLPAYADWLHELADELDVSDGVIFTGYVSQQDLVTYYELASVYVSMSEHEGLGKPLLESMYFDVPVLAYAAAAVPETLGDGGVLFRHKDYEALAEFVDLFMHEAKLQHGVITRQRKRIQAFLEPQVRLKWQRILERYFDS
jgi:glycosyltransferase involved in cell wall biosynthesis